MREQVEALEDHAHAPADLPDVSVAREPGSSASSRRPSTVTVPPWNGSRPFRQRRNVLLPPPDGPMIAATSPRATRGSTPRRTSRAPCRLTRSSHLDHANAPPFRGSAPSRPLRPAREPRQRQAHRHVQHRRRQRELDDAPRAVGQDRVLLGQLDQRDHRADRRVLEQGDEVIRDRRDHDPHGLRHDHPPQGQPRDIPSASAASIWPAGIACRPAR